VGPSGLEHSFLLGQYLKARFALVEPDSPDTNRLGFWATLRQQGYTLESLYAELEAALPGKSAFSSTTSPHS
jgi:hypothetical protein